METILVIAGGLLNWLVAIVVTYLLWNKSHPQKWREASRMLLVFFVLVFVIGILAAIIIIAVNPTNMRKEAEQLKLQSEQEYQYYRQMEQEAKKP